MQKDQDSRESWKPLRNLSRNIQRLENQENYLSFPRLYLWRWGKPLRCLFFIIESCYYNHRSWWILCSEFGMMGSHFSKMSQLTINQRIWCIETQYSCSHTIKITKEQEKKWRAPDVHLKPKWVSKTQNLRIVDEVGLTSDLNIKIQNHHYKRNSFSKAQKYLSLSDRSDILRELTMHMPVQPLEHRRSFHESKWFVPMLGESSQKYGKPKNT